MWIGSPAISAILYFCTETERSRAWPEKSLSRGLGEDYDQLRSGETIGYP
jgi:hypothetical protein